MAINLSQIYKICAIKGEYLVSQATIKEGRESRPTQFGKVFLQLSKQRFLFTIEVSFITRS